MIAGKNLIGLKVYFLNSGERSYAVKDLIFDGGINNLVALVVEKEEYPPDARVIFFEDIITVGNDAVIVASEENLKNDQETAYLENGKQRGEDIYFEAKNGEVVKAEDKLDNPVTQTNRKIKEVNDQMQNQISYLEIRKG